MWGFFHHLWKFIRNYIWALHFSEDTINHVSWRWTTFVMSFSWDWHYFSSYWLFSLEVEKTVSTKVAGACMSRFGRNVSQRVGKIQSPNCRNLFRSLHPASVTSHKMRFVRKSYEKRTWGRIVDTGCKQIHSHMVPEPYRRTRCP
jgi:hypothetical protein